MVADCLVVVSALEYVYDGKTRWPRAGTTAALFAFQVRVCRDTTAVIARPLIERRLIERPLIAAALVLLLLLH